MRNHVLAEFCSAVVRKGTLTLSLALCTLGLCLIASAQQLSFVTFDAPGAGTAQSQGTGCFAYTDCSVIINNFGAVTGYYLDANNVFHGFVRSPQGSFTTFEAPGADTTPQSFNGTLPNAINDLGAVTGPYYDVNGLEHGFLLSPDGVFTTFDVPDSTIGTTSPININLEGAIVGYYLDQNGVFHGFLRNPNGKFETWSGPDACDTTPQTGCYGTGAFGINIFGTATGGYEDNSGNFVGHGLVRSPKGEFTTYEVPGAGTGLYEGSGCPGCSVGLNFFGAIASYYIDNNDLVHGFLRSPAGTFATFDAPGEGPDGVGCYSDCPIGLNDWGAITGIYLDANNVYHGFLRSPEGSFTTFEAPGADTTPGSYNGTLPYSINDQGVVTGYYIDANNVNHGFLAIPCANWCDGTDQATTALAVQNPTIARRPDADFLGTRSPKLRQLGGRLTPRSRGDGAQPSK
jgi:hypothetical protein